MPTGTGGGSGGGVSASSPSADSNFVVSAAVEEDMNNGVEEQVVESPTADDAPVVSQSQRYDVESAVSSA